MSIICSAGHDHDELRADDTAWSQLEYVGIQSDEVETIEMRNCACHSTLCRVVPKRERHHNRCMTPGDDGHLTCPVVAGRSE